MRPDSEEPDSTGLDRDTPAASPDNPKIDDSDGASPTSAPLPQHHTSPPPAAGGPGRSAPTSGLRYTFSSLQNRNFLLLWLGTLCLMSGMQMQMIARGYLVYELTESGALLGIVNGAGSLPVLGLALFGGAVADRVNRKRLVQGGQAVATAIALSVAILITTGTVTWVHLLIAGMLQGAMWSFMMPARESLIPQLVGQRMTGNAVALSAAAMGTTTLVAPAIAGVLYAVIGPEGVYYIVCGLSTMAIVLTTAIPVPIEKETRPKAPIMGEIGAGLTYILQNRLILVLLGVMMASVVLAMPIRFFLPVLVVDVFHRQSEAFGLLTSVMGLGSLAGALAIASMGPWWRGRVLIAGSFISAIGLLLLGVVPMYAAAFVFMAMVGLGDSTRRALNQALIIENTDSQYRGRVISVVMMNFGLMPLGVLPAGIAIDIVGVQAVIAIMGVAMLAVTTLVLVTQKGLRQLH